MRGNSLVEILIAISLLGLILTSIGLLFSQNQLSLIDIVLRFQALNYAKISLWEALNSDFYTLNSTSSVSDRFNIQLIVTEKDNFSKNVASLVSWTDRQKSHSLELTGLMSSPKDAFGQSDCKLIGKEDWANSQVVTGPSFGFGNQVTGLFGRDGLVYLTTNNASPRDPLADPNDFFVVDIRQPSQSLILSKMDTGPGLVGLVVVGRYVFLGNTSINAQLQVVDISNPTHPVIVSSYKLPGNYTDETTVSNSVFYYDGRIYLGTAKSQIEELHIIDVHNPLAPSEIGKWETGAAINSIYVQNHFVYLATPNGVELNVLDINDTTHPIPIGSFDAPGGSGNGKSLDRDRSILYLGRTVGKNELFALDLKNPLAITSLGSLAISDSINDLIAYVGRIFLITNSKVEIINAANPSSMQIEGIFDLPARGTGLSCSGRSLLASFLSEKGLMIFTPH